MFMIWEKKMNTPPLFFLMHAFAFLIQVLFRRGPHLPPLHFLLFSFFLPSFTLAPCYLPRPLHGRKRLGRTNTPAMIILPCLHLE